MSGPKPQEIVLTKEMRQGLQGFLTILPPQREYAFSRFILPNHLHSECFTLLPNHFLRHVYSSFLSDSL